ncbi:MAG: hypothetical protein ABI580_02260, partial [Burkholderiaceae bacterium]
NCYLCPRTTLLPMWMDRTDQTSNNGMQRTALRAAADAKHWTVNERPMAADGWPRVVPPGRGHEMIKLAIPGFGPLEISRVVTDYTGTHSFKGVVRRSVRTRLARLAKLVEIHVLTVDTFGTARRELAQLPVELHLLNNKRRNDKEKQRFVLKYQPKHVAAFGNGTIDPNRRNLAHDCLS